MSQEIINKVKSGIKGFYIGNRIILPFRCLLIKLIVQSDIFTEFVGNQHIKISQEAKNTSIYFRETGKLSELQGSYQYIKLIVAGIEEDLTDRTTHIKLVCKILDDHEVDIEFPSDDVLFIE